MTLRVGVIGAGMIGEEHVRRLTGTLAGAEVVAVSDVDTGRAEAVAALAPAARVLGTGEQVIGDGAVDAVLVASSGPTHEPYVLAAIAAGKPVLCEKPLATTREACERILDAETAAGRRLVQVGFMRRYDPAFRALKTTVDSGAIGPPLLLHCAHRNASVPPTYTDDMMVNDSAVHEIDAARWLLGEEVGSVRVLEPRRSSRAPERLRDPLLLVLESTGGVLVDVELSVSVGYGYDIRCEVVGESGTAALPPEGQVLVARDGLRGSPVPHDWRDRFARAYEIELQAWLDASAAGGCTGPSAWDGYAAAVVAQTCLAAPRTGEPLAVEMRDRPALYDAG